MVIVIEMCKSFYEQKLNYLKMCGGHSDYVPNINIYENIIVDLSLLNHKLMESLKCAKICEM